MKAVQQLTEEQVDFIKLNGSYVTDGVSGYYRIPFWFEDKGDGIFIFHHDNSLPTSLEKALKKLGIKNEQ